MEKIRKTLLLTLCWLVLGVDVVFGIRAVVYIVFFYEPIPCKVYLEKKQYFDETLVEKGRPFVSGSFFQAKVQILGVPIGPAGGYKTQVKVVEVLEGVSPGSKITVQYPASPGFRALPKDYREEDFYFIMGGVDNSGVVGLFGVESLFDGKTIANYHKPHWAIAWFYQMLSPCETV